MKLESPSRSRLIRSDLAYRVVPHPEQSLGWESTIVSRGLGPPLITTWGAAMSWWKGPDSPSSLLHLCERMKGWNPFEIKGRANYLRIVLCVGGLVYKTKLKVCCSTCCKSVQYITTVDVLTWCAQKFVWQNTCGTQIWCQDWTRRLFWLIKAQKGSSMFKIGSHTPKTVGNAVVLQLFYRGCFYTIIILPLKLKATHSLVLDSLALFWRSWVQNWSKITYFLQFWGFETHCWPYLTPIWAFMGKNRLLAQFWHQVWVPQLFCHGSCFALGTFARTRSK